MGRTTESRNGINQVGDDGDTVVDASLFRTIGLYQLLRPADSGSFGRLARTAYVFALWLTVGVHAVQIVGLYYATNDFRRFITMTALTMVRMTSSYKGYLLVTNSDRFSSVLDVARYGFIRCGRRDPSRLIRCRTTCAAVLRPFAALCAVMVVFWSSMPLFVDERSLTVVQLDGTVINYRTSIDNIWFPLPESVYNSTPVWYPIYGLEVFLSVVTSFNYMVFDCYLFTVCSALDAQFQTLSDGYRTIGRQINIAPSPRPSDIYMESDEINSKNYKKLMSLIQDNKKIIKKFNEFFDIVQPIVLIQVIDSSILLVALSFLISLLYVMGWSIVSAPILKYMIAFVLTTFELYIYCRVFHHIESAASDVNFGLYSSDWTDMDLRFKKSMLLAMNMNSSQKRTMKVTQRSIVNLEMFASVMSMTYTIVSVLLKINT